MINKKRWQKLFVKIEIKNLAMLHKVNFKVEYPFFSLYRSFKKMNKLCVGFCKICFK